MWRRRPTYLYHGTPTVLTRLEPRPAHGGRSAKDRFRAVYASDARRFALAFALPLAPDVRGRLAWSLVHRGKTPRITIHSGRLDTTRVGYLYRVPSDTFTPLDDLQWVSHVSVVPEACEVVDPRLYADWVATDPASARDPDRSAAAPWPGSPRSSKDVRVDFNRVWRHTVSRFVLPEHSIHGPAHWRRVERNGLRLAARTGADTTVVRLFAIFHDCRRRNDLHDVRHGLRGANFAASLQGTLFDLPDETLELLRVACTWHSDGFTHADPTVGTCWDADRLDLIRVGVVPDPRFMSTDFGRELARGVSRDLRRQCASTDECDAMRWLREYGR